MNRLFGVREAARRPAAMLARLIVAASVAVAAPVASGGGGAIFGVLKFPTSTSPLEPGGVAQFTIILTNSGGSAVTGARIVDDVPTGLFGMSWSCQGFGGATCANASGGGAIDEALDGLVPGGSLEYEAMAQAETVLPPYVTNVASVSVPVGSSCFDNETPPCRSLASLATGPNVNVILGADVPAAVPGGNIQYVLVAENNGTVAATGTVVRNPLPQGLSAYAWTCLGTDGAVCPVAAGSGTIDLAVTTWPAAGVLTFTIDAQVGAGAPAEIVNTALLIPPYGGNCGKLFTTPPCVATATVATGPRLIAGKTGEYIPAPESIFYTLTVENIGTDASGTQVTDNLPAGVADFNWTCTASAGAVCPAAGGTGPINQLIAVLPNGGTLNYAVTASLAAPLPPSISNTLVAQPPAGGVCGESGSPPPCSATVSVTLPLDTIAVSKSADLAGASPGSNVVYTVTIENLSASTPATTLQFNDPVPPGIAQFDSWTCFEFGAANCPVAAGSGALNQVISLIPPESGLEYTINATVAATPPLEVVNIATVVPPAGFGCGGLQPDPPCAATSILPSTGQFLVEMQADASQIGPGGEIRYVLDIYNYGADTQNVQIENPLPAGVVSATWTCLALDMTCPGTSGVGGISQLISVFPGSGAGLRYEFTATLAATPPAGVTNTLTVNPQPTDRCGVIGLTPLTAPPCTVQMTNSLAPLIAVEKTVDRAQLLRGGPVNYQITVRNSGGNEVGTQLSDPLPLGLDIMDWTCAGYFGASCPSFSGSGGINAVFGAFPADGFVIYSVSGQVAQTAPASVTNVAGVVPPAGGSCAPPGCAASVTSPVANVPAANLHVSIAADVQTAMPDTAVTYEIDIRNSGLATAGPVLVSNPVPAGLTAVSWSCEGPECPSAAGVGAIAQNVPSMVVYVDDFGGDPDQAGRLVYTVNATVASVPPPIINNIVTLTPSGEATCEGAVCTATSTLPTGFVGAPQLAVGKTANLTQLTPGAPVQYTVSVANSGSADAGQTQLVDAIPAGITSFAWTCAQTGGAVCPAVAGSGALNQTIAAIPVGGSLVYGITAQVSPNPPTAISNNAVVTPPPGGTCVPASCVATLTLPVAVQAVAEVFVNKTSDAGSGTVLLPGQAVAWTVTASNLGAATVATVTLVDSLPANIRDVRVLPDPGVACDAATPPAGSAVTCTIAPGFTGVRRFRISAVVLAADGQGGVRNSVAASGVDGPVCSGCVAVNPVGVGADVALGNPRPFSAAGIAGTLFDVVNLSSASASAVEVTLTPASATRLLAVFASGCTANAGANPGSVEVSCPNPPSTQGVSCVANRCTVASLAQGTAVTLFVALNPGAGPAIVRGEVAGDPDPSNNELALPQGGTP